MIHGVSALLSAMSEVGAAFPTATENTKPAAVPRAGWSFHVGVTQGSRATLALSTAGDLSGRSLDRNLRPTCTSHILVIRIPEIPLSGEGVAK